MYSKPEQPPALTPTRSPPPASSFFTSIFRICFDALSVIWTMTFPDWPG